MRTVKKIIRILLFLLLIILLWNIRLVLYGIDQLRGQLNIIWNAKPVEEVLKDPNLNPDYRRKLLIIAEIKKFAVDSIGLKGSDNYTTFFDQQNKPVLWVLTACEPFSLKAYQWHFPFLGNVSYKGFFIKEDGEIELAELRKKGYDADLSTTSAWSTLGWFKDPVLSNFLKRSEGRIAETIIHELTHTTVYFKSSVDYNENLATFIGERGAENFLKYKFGNDSKELQDYIHHQKDEEIYGDLLIKGGEQLDSLYKAMKKTQLTSSEKIFRKYKTIAEIFLEINRQNFYTKKYYHFNFGKERLPNNTFFMSVLRYRKKQDDFEKSFKEKYNSSLKAFVEEIKKQK